MNRNEFIKKVNHSGYTIEVLNILERAYGVEVEHHKKDRLAFLMTQIVDEPLNFKKEILHTSLDNFIKGLIYSECTENLLYLLENKRGYEGKIDSHKIDNLCTLLMNIFNYSSRESGSINIEPCSCYEHLSKLPTSKWPKYTGCNSTKCPIKLVSNVR